MFGTWGNREKVNKTLETSVGPQRTNHRGAQLRVNMVEHERAKSLNKEKKTSEWEDKNQR